MAIALNLGYFRLPLTISRMSSQKACPIIVLCGSWWREVNRPYGVFPRINGHRFAPSVGGRGAGPSAHPRCSCTRRPCALAYPFLSRRARGGNKMGSGEPLSDIHSVADFPPLGKNPTQMSTPECLLLCSAAVLRGPTRQCSERVGYHPVPLRA